MTSRTSPVVLVLLLGALALAVPPLAAVPSPGNPPGFAPPVAMPGSTNGSEPSIAVGRLSRAGVRFVSWQVPGEVAVSSDGLTFTNTGFPDPAGGGDVTNAIDASDTFFLGQFCGGAFTLHACLQRSEDGGQTWPVRTDFADMHPGAADRPWIEVFPHGSEVPWNPENTRVYLEYHTFTPEELAYVTVSEDGGRTFSEPKIITSDTNALIGSGCNTVPGGLAIDQRDGTVYALWLSGNDVASSVMTGCNYSQIGPFNKAWVSTSTDGGGSWTSHLAWEGGFDPITKIGDNADKLFPTIAVDRAGQVHVVLAVRRNDDPVGYVAACEVDPNTCAESPQDTDLLIVTSPDRGQHWTQPASLEGESGSYFFPWITAGSQGVVDAIYYKSSTRQPNKRDSIWFIHHARITGAVATYSGGPHADYVSPPAALEAVVDPGPAHGNGVTGGGICTFGVFCAVLGSQNGNRRLADSIAIALDPAGGANLVWTDDAGNPNNARQIHFACQSSGASALAGAPDLNGCYGPTDLAVAIAAAPEPVLQTGQVTYDITVTNHGTANGPATTSGVTLTDPLPAGLSLVSASASAGTCGTSDPVTCDLGILPGGATATVTIVAAVSGQASGTLANTVTVTALTADPEAGNNTATAFTTVAPAADLAVAIAASPDPVAKGADLFYTVVVTNAGPSAATGVTLNDQLSKGANIEAAAASQGSCSVQAGKRLVACDLGDLASGASATVQVAVKATIAGTLTSTAAASAASPADPDPANNTASATTQVLP